MRKIIFRDDDTSYFTQPEHLDAIYGRIWDAGLPVCLAVIPNVYGDIRVYWSEGNPFDPGIPPQYRGQNKHFSILDNPQLCEFLIKKAQAGLVEICLHGYSHTFYEFTTHDTPVIQQKIEDGLAILNQAFPNIPIRTFIAPYDRLSPIALTELIKRGFNISTQSTNLAPLPYLPQLEGHEFAYINDSQKLYVCDNYFYTHRDDPHDSLMNVSKHIALYKLTTITNHYWMFFNDWEPNPNPNIMLHWDKFLDQILDDRTIQITQFDAEQSLDSY